MFGMFYLNILTNTGLEIQATEQRHEHAHTDIQITIYEESAMTPLNKSLKTKLYPMAIWPLHLPLPLYLTK